LVRIANEDIGFNGQVFSDVYCSPAWTGKPLPGGLAVLLPLNGQGSIAFFNSLSKYPKGHEIKPYLYWQRSPAYAWVVGFLNVC
jgi:hypothetical protein